MSLYLVTGGCGFIGSHLCHRLIQLGHQVFVIDNLSTGKLNHLPSEAVFFKGDVRDLDLLMDVVMSHSIDGCFHLAAMASVPLCNESWVDAHHINLSATMNVFELARRVKAKHASSLFRVVYASSAAVYGDSQSLPLSETISAPISFYGLNKLSCEHYAKMAEKLYGISSVGLRLFNIYGPRQNPNSSYTGVITIFLNKVLKDEPLIIYGDGKQSRDFVYVQDAVGFCIKAMDVLLNQSEVINVCSGNSTTIREVGDQLAAIAHVVPQYVYEPLRSGDIYHSLGNPSYASQILNAKTSTTLQDGLHQLVEYQKKQIILESAQ